MPRLFAGSGSPFETPLRNGVVYPFDGFEGSAELANLCYSGKMIAEMWDTFPRQLVRNINALLEAAEPNAAKAYQLYKACQREDLWTDSFEEFSKRLEAFYARPKAQRRKSDFDVFLDRPMHKTMFGDFHLNFRTARIDSRAIHSLASWASNLIRVGAKTTSLVISLDVMTKTLRAITNPPPFEKAEDIEFEDFCSAWRKTVFNLFGRAHDSELTGLLTELRRLHLQIQDAEKMAIEKSLTPTIYLTQTEIDWTLAVRKSAVDGDPAPKFPLSRGPQKQRLIELERACLLYNLVHTTRWPELQKHRERIRATILDRCDGLIREKAS